MRTPRLLIAAVLWAALACAQTPPSGSGRRPAPAQAQAAAPDKPDPVVQKLEAAVAELAAARERIAREKVPLAAELSGLEEELLTARKEFEDARRQVDGRSLELNNLRNDIKAREQEQSYLANLFGEYIRNLESRVHIAELQRYQADFEAARLAPDREDLAPAARFAVQVRVIGRSLRRLDELNGGLRFAGRAAGESGLVKDGSFVLIGPVACFAADDGSMTGLAEQRLGSLEASIAPFAEPAWSAHTLDLARNGQGTLPFDGTLGNARKIEETRETLGEHIRKGGAVMYPILALAALIALLGATKWFALAIVRLPGRRKTAALHEALRRGDREDALRALDACRGPAGRMLRAGLETWGSPKDVIEEAMFEVMLDIRFRFNKGLPFIAVGAACAPLLGLLGTVTGIISTFKLITVFGSGDVKMLSAGISEALITTEFGLLVAIPSLLMHSFLSRKSRALLDQFEQLALAFLGVLSEYQPPPATPATEPVSVERISAEEMEAAPA